MLPSTQRLLRDCALVAVVGVIVGLVANAVSPHGLSVTRDYFSSAPAVSSNDHEQSRSRTDSTAPGRSGTPLPAANYTEIDHAEAARLFQDPRRSEGRILFVDARDEKRFAAGHIPGARLFDHYHPEQYIQDLLAAAALADTIVLYCNGGTCEDSRLVAGDLTALGVPASRLAVYVGGFSGWRRQGMPVERSERAP